MYIIMIFEMRQIYATALGWASTILAYKSFHQAYIIIISTSEIIMFRESQ